MGEVDLWPICIDAFRAISTHYIPAMDEVGTEHELSAEEGWLLVPALSFEPEVVSAERLRIRSPYDSERRFDVGLKKMAERGFLLPVEGLDRAYRLTPRGREAVLNILGAAYRVMGELQPLPTEESEALSNQLFKLVEACLDAPEPPGKWSITHSRRLDPGEDAAVMVRIDQYLSDLAAYRDDCHLAAWQIHEIEGHAWEIFSLLWRQAQLSITDIPEKLHRRGFNPAEHDDALADLVRRGWVDLERADYLLTRLGKEIREAVEAETDRYFYRPWTCLSVHEIASLKKQMIQLSDSLKPKKC